MQTYYLTVYAQTGEALLNESFEAENDEAATNMGKEKLNEKGHEDITGGLISLDGRLLLFHR